jgi:hypothetical protein
MNLLDQREEQTNGAKEIWKLNPSDGQSKHIKAQLVGCVLTKFYFVLITKTFCCFNWWKDFKLTTFIDSINGFGFNFTSLLIFYFRSWTIFVHSTIECRMKLWTIEQSQQKMRFDPKNQLDNMGKLSRDEKN